MKIEADGSEWEWVWHGKLCAYRDEADMKLRIVLHTSSRSMQLLSVILALLEVFS
jgi:hypothetical protein